MDELVLKYGCNPSQSPARIYREDGKLPVTPSGGLLGEGNPIGAGMSRMTWTWLQVKGLAGDCQVERDVDTALSSGWGGMYQYNATMVIGRD